MGPAITISAGFVSLRAKCPYRDRVVLCASIFALRDRKSTRLNSSHGYISYAVFCLKKKKNKLNLSPFQNTIQEPDSFLIILSSYHSCDTGCSRDPFLPVTMSCVLWDLHTTHALDW